MVITALYEGIKILRMHENPGKGDSDHNRTFADKTRIAPIKI